MAKIFDNGGGPSGIKAKDILPKVLHKLGMDIFGDESELDAAVLESVEVNMTYNGTPMVLRILAGDSAAQRLSTGDGEYPGLDSLEDLRKSKNDTVNMIDLGANYGVVPIAVFKKYPGLVRAVVVEPVAVTYFFLRWNLWINDVPHHSHKTWLSDSKKPGVRALNAAVTETDGEDVQMCSHPSVSMNSRTSTAAEHGIHPVCNCSFETCAKVPGVSTEGLLDYFGEDTVTLLKMDCEGCEYQGLPAIAKHPKRIARLVGELHAPEENLIDIACLYEEGEFMTKVCRVDKANWSCCLPLDCTEGRKKCVW
jgi:FkbM family methyltransferase